MSRWRNTLYLTTTLEIHYCQACGCFETDIYNWKRWNHFSKQRKQYCIWLGFLGKHNSSFKRDNISIYPVSAGWILMEGRLFWWNWIIICLPVQEEDRQADKQRERQKASEARLQGRPGPPLAGNDITWALWLHPRPVISPSPDWKIGRAG